MLKCEQRGKVMQADHNVRAPASALIRATVTIPLEVFVALQAAAKEQRRSVSAQVVMFIEQALKQVAQ